MTQTRARGDRALSSRITSPATTARPPGHGWSILPASATPSSPRAPAGSTCRKAAGGQPKPLSAGAFQGAISSFRLHLAAEAKAAKTVRMYPEAVQWFAAAHLLRETRRTDRDQVCAQDIQRWMVWLLGRYSDSCASNQYRALQQFFGWWSDEEELPRPHGAASAAGGEGEACSCLHQRRTVSAGAGLPGADVRPAPRLRDHRRVHGHRHPAVRAGRGPLPPG